MTRIFIIAILFTIEVLAALPTVPPGFEISVFAGEPLIYKPTSICFDDKGNMMVGQGPQYSLDNVVT